MKNPEQILLWLADCEAATLEHLKSLKSTSASELKRHRSICDTLLKSLQAGDLVGTNARKLEHVQERLIEALEPK